jgi:hypothetical protein
MDAWEFETTGACRAKQPTESGSDAPKSLYMQDLEERARLRGTTVDEVYRNDESLLSNSRPSTECLRPEEVMECAADPSRLSHRSWMHFQVCEFCRSLVAFARPDGERTARMAAQLAARAEESVPAAALSSPRVVRWTEAVIGGVDQMFSAAWRYSPALAVCFLVIYFASPDWLRTSTPPWIWTNRQLHQSAARILQKGNSAEAYTLANELIKREPDNLNGHLLRYQVLAKEGKTDLAGKEAARLVHDILEPMEPKDQAMTLSSVVGDVALQVLGEKENGQKEILRRLRSMNDILTKASSSAGTPSESAGSKKSQPSR